MLLLRHPTVQRHFYDPALFWLRDNFPQLLPHFELRDLPCRTLDTTGLRVVVPWVQDPVQAWSPATYEHLLEIQKHCDAAGIRVFNRVDRLTHTGKAEASARLGAAGFITPRTARITDAALFAETLCGLTPPLFVREDWQHGGEMLRADTIEDARALPIGHFRRPAAVQWVDASADDGLYRKWRYFCCAGLGVSHHLQISATWITRGEHRVKTDAAYAEELAYISALDPFHAEFQRAMQLLQLDMAGFDYGRRKSDGRMVVWEVNPFPHLLFSTANLAFRNRAMHRSFAAMLGAYLEAAGIALPQGLRAVIEY